MRHTGDSLRAIRPDVPNVAVFDTAFHQSMPPKAFHYALPHELYRMHHVRRYGFHGSSHQYVAKEASSYLGIPEEHLNLITLHLGNGASAAALQGGKSIDTSMGLTPLEGLIMGTRCGDLDPAVHFYISRKTNKPFEAIEDVLNKESGLLGLSGVSNDLRDVEATAAEGDERCRLALALYCYRLKKYVGAFAAVMGGLDALAFTAGVGENSPEIRAAVCDGLSFLGVELDSECNASARGVEREISAKHSRARVFVVPTDEERLIADETVALVASMAVGAAGKVLPKNHSGPTVPSCRDA